MFALGLRLGRYDLRVCPVTALTLPHRPDEARAEVERLAEGVATYQAGMARAYRALDPILNAALRIPSDSIGPAAAELLDAIAAARGLVLPEPGADPT